jgi:hypothetical protein
MDFVWIVLDLLRRAWQRAGPYLVVELVLPGGTLIALLLFCYRRWRLAEAPQCPAR